MEVMALESLVASVWRLDGFLCITRHPLRVQRGYSDVDVIGVRSEDDTIRVGECKARGPARQVYVETDGQQWNTWWDDALMNLPRLWEQRPPWLPALSRVKTLEYHLVGNVWFADDRARELAEARLKEAVVATLRGDATASIDARVVPSFDLILKAIESVRREVVEEGWGKRYGDPLLDALRELIRYTHPWPSGGGRIGATIQSEVRRRLGEAIGD